MKSNDSFEIWESQRDEQSRIPSLFYLKPPRVWKDLKIKEVSCRFAKRACDFNLKFFQVISNDLQELPIWKARAAGTRIRFQVC